MRHRFVIAGALLAVAPQLAAAQEAPTFRSKHITVSAGILLDGAYGVGDLTATLRRNSLGTPPPFTLLRAESEITSHVGAEARVAVALTSAFAIEASGSYGAPQLAVTISQDAEAAAGASASEQIDEYTADVSGIYQLPVSFGRHARPYVIGGAGYLRQLHEGRLSVETGNTIHVGAGVQYWFRGGHTRGKSVGARGEARYVRRSGGIEFEDSTRNFPTFSVLAFFGF